MGEARWVHGAAVAAIGACLVATFLLALMPTSFYDDLVYHLGLPRQALLGGSWPTLRDFHYSYMPAGWDSVYVLPLAMGGGSGPQLMNFVALALLAATTYRLARHGAGRAGAAVATALLVVAPMFLALGALAGNDLFTGLALACALEALTGPVAQPARAGILGAAAWAAKYTSLPALAGMGLALLVLPPHGSDAPAGWRRMLSGWRGALVFAALVGMAASPWTMRTFVLTGNPVYPAHHHLLGGREWDALSAERAAADVSHGAYHDRGWRSFPLSLWDLLTASTRLGNPAGLGPAFVVVAAIGLALCWRHVRSHQTFAIVAAVTWVGWCVTSLNLRYAIILLVAVAPFAAAACDRAIASALAAMQGSKLAVAYGTGVFALMVAVVAASGFQAVHGYPVFVPLLDAPATRRDFLVQHLSLAVASREMAARLPAGARIMLIADARLALMPRPASASSFYDKPGVLRYVRGCRTPEDVDARLRANGVTHVVVDFRELSRRIADYGYLARFTPDEADLFGAWLAHGLTPVARWESVALYEVPAG